MTRNETPEQTIRRCGDVLTDDIAQTIQRQASDALALVAITLFLGTIAIVAQLAMH